MTTTLDDLIARLSAATGASRELDAEIWLATRIGWSSTRRAHWGGMQPKGDTTATDERYALERAPNFTRDFDAARPLILWPDWELKSLPHRDGYAVTIFVGAVFYRGEAPTEARAACIAALKARKARP